MLQRVEYNPIAYLNAPNVDGLNTVDLAALIKQLTEKYQRWTAADYLRLLTAQIGNDRKN